MQYCNIWMLEQDNFHIYVTLKKNEFVIEKHAR